MFATSKFTEAFKARAIELDDHFTRTVTTVGPLHGLPISLKNQCNIQGVEMNMDYVGWVGRIAERNSVVVEILVKQGAVLFVLTNMAQVGLIVLIFSSPLYALFSSDSVNNLYGRTVNPFNRALVAGGSSGGEGALIGLRGSPLGVGSDIGGSMR